MITSTITILCEGSNRLTYETKKPRNDEDLARRLGPTDRPTDGRTDGRTDKPAYRDARTHLKTFIRRIDRSTNGLIDIVTYRVAWTKWIRRKMIF